MITLDTPGKECKFNLYVDCEEQDKCSKCGWNPQVQKKRIEKIKLKEEAKNDE